MDAVKHVISGEVVAIGLASVSSKRKVKNGELSNSIKSKVETPERGLEQVGRNASSHVLSESYPKRREDLKWQKRLQIVLGI